MDKEQLLGERIERLEEAHRDILDVITGWTRNMSDEEKLVTIKTISRDAVIEGGEMDKELEEKKEELRVRVAKLDISLWPWRFKVLKSECNFTKNGSEER